MPHENHRPYRINHSPVSRQPSNAINRSGNGVLPGGLMKPVEIMETELVNHTPNFVGEVWNELASIDLTGYTKTLKHANNATYLPWSNAWTLIMQRYPASSYTFNAPMEYENKSVEIWCKLTISDGEQESTRAMWLPVMDGKNNAIFEPSSRAISDARMRCLVKCAAMFGLGVHLYAGEDLPKVDNAPTLPHGLITEEQITFLQGKLTKTNTEAKDFLAHYGIESLEELPAEKYQNAKALLGAKEKRANDD